MVDVRDIETRSYNMRQIKSKNTRPAMLVRKFLNVHGFRYSLPNKKLPNCAGFPGLIRRLGWISASGEDSSVIQPNARRPRAGSLVNFDRSCMLIPDIEQLKLAF
ncbi:MAG: hypothetical protein R3B47_15170 [Bacteroidia bacterium]